MHLFECINLEKYLISLLAACDHGCFRIALESGRNVSFYPRPLDQKFRCRASDSVCLVCLFVSLFCLVCLFEKGSFYIESWLSWNSLHRPSFLSSQRFKNFCLLTAGIKVCATTPSRSYSLFVFVFCFNIALQCAQAS